MQTRSSSKSNRKRNESPDPSSSHTPGYSPTKSLPTSPSFTYESSSEDYIPTSPPYSPSNQSDPESSAAAAKSVSKNSHQRYNPPVKKADPDRLADRIERVRALFPSLQIDLTTGNPIPHKGRARSHCSRKINTSSPSIKKRRGAVSKSVEPYSSEEESTSKSRVRRVITEIAFSSNNKAYHPNKLTQAQGTRALEQGYLTNVSVSPSVKRAAQGLESVKEAKALNQRSKNLLQLLTVQCAERDNHLNQVEHQLNLHFEEKKAQALAKYSELLSKPGNLSRQYSLVTRCFDKQGSSILFGAKVKVDSPFPGEPFLAKIIQLLEDNIVLAYIQETGKVGGFLGTQIVVITTSV